MAEKASQGNSGRPFGGLNNIDIGDIILLLIVILLILEEDDMDLIIVLGLVLLLGI